VKLAQHSFPIRILIRFREEAIRELNQAIQDRDVERDG
jgi:hypothetical protein